jgi:heat shock protein beta
LRVGQFEADKEDEKAATYAKVLWETALLESGFELDKPKEFNARVYGLLAEAYSIKGDVTVSKEAAEAAAAEEVGHLMVIWGCQPFACP